MIIFRIFVYVHANTPFTLEGTNKFKNIIFVWEIV